jgi:sec-independent protein translocase protein TatA
MPVSLLTPSHILILLVIILLIVGPKRLPQAGHALGESFREFKRGITGRSEEPGSVTQLGQSVTAPPTDSPPK